MKQLLIVTLASALLVTPTVASAAAFLSADTIAPPDDLAEDLYAAGEKIEINHTIAGDAFLAGDTVATAGIIQGDIAAAGNTVVIDGTIDDDIFAAGNRVTITAPRADDVFIAGDSLTISDDTTITGDVYAAGSRIELAGTIEGDVRIVGEQITISSGTTINGDLQTYGSNEPIISPDATINGNQEHHVPHTPAPRQQLQATLLNWVRSVVTWFVVGLLILYLLPNFTGATVALARTKTLPAFGVGVLWLIILIPLVILLFVTVVGIPVAFALLFATPLLVLVSLAYATLLTGAVAARLLTKQTSDKLTWVHVLLGAVVFKTLGHIPVIGWLAGMIIIVIAFGSVLMTLWSYLSSKQSNTGHTK